MKFLPKCVVVAYVVATPTVISILPYKHASRTLQESSNLAYSTSIIAAVYYKLAEDREVQMTRHKIVESKDSQLLTRDWQNKVHISEACSEYRGKFMKKLMQFSYMWDGHLGQISIIKHRIELLSSSNPVYSAAYRAGHTVREFLRLEIEKMLSQNVIERAQTEWTASINFAPNNIRILPLLSRPKEAIQTGILSNSKDGKVHGLPR